ncbi:MAG: hypothetical protein HC796_05840 [Synechococcaceae cyanobacterium RL_1_2]|nr:hypothetical protein [Synechococcaceae cyanobacterium RL_1_2]
MAIKNPFPINSLGFTGALLVKNEKSWTN